MGIVIHTARSLVVIGLLAVLLALPAMARGEWYDHYRDGRQALDSGDPAEAIERLRAALAIKKRSGYLRTYGNNYVRYIPHYYLGVAYHDSDDCEAAMASFDRSEAADETGPLPELADRLQSFRADCEIRLAPPPPPEEVPPPKELTPLDVATADEPPVDPDALERALRKYLSGDMDEAIRVFDELVRASPESARLHLFLGTALHSSWVIDAESDPDLLERSRRELAEAARLDPTLLPHPALCPPRVIALYRSLR